MDVKPNVKFETAKPKRRRYRVEDPDFKPPDGGWGWLVLLACGFSNLCAFPMFQQFGLMFRKRFQILGLTNVETTTVVNLNLAFNSCVGLLNGPLFKVFTYRQVAFFGSSLIVVALFISTFCSSFWTYLIFYSICYGSGIGINQSANALALNTYFKSKRRIATGLSWTITGIGPILLPYIITALIDLYEMEGTLLIFSAFAGHAVMCSLLLQPVHWHTEFREVEVGDVHVQIPLIQEPVERNLHYFDKKKKDENKKSRRVFSGHYMFNEDDHHKTGYEITDPGTPMMVHANDGWYAPNSLGGSRMSLASNRSSRFASGQNSVAFSTRPSYNNLAEAKSRKSSLLSLPQEGKDKKRKISLSKPKIEESLAEDSPSEKALHDLKREEKALLQQRSLEPELKEEEEPLLEQKPPEQYSKEGRKLLEPDLKEGEVSVQRQDSLDYPNEKLVLKTAARKLEEYRQETETEAHHNGATGHEDAEKEENRKYTFLEKVLIFFDLNLLKDPIYVNIMLGITLANFVEINFSVLTPFVLHEFRFDNYQIATFMSLLGATDICVRFFIPFLASKIGWTNRGFFLFGVLGMALGRIILVHTQTYHISLLVAIMIGFGKGLRTIFIALVIPSHVPLERLPAASGLQLATAGIVTLTAGPIIGWIRDAVNNYTITLHLLNIFTYTTAISWTLEWIILSRKNKNKKKSDTETNS